MSLLGRAAGLLRLLPLCLYHIYVATAAQAAWVVDYRPSRPRLLFLEKNAALPTAAVQRRRGPQPTYYSQRTTTVTTTTTTTLGMADVGIFFGTSTGNTETCAEKIQAAFGSDVAAEPVDVDTLDAGTLADALGRHDALVVGTPTWNTGADTERSGTGWDELYYGPLQDAASAVGSKKVAVFGLGDQVSYAENYADATGELFDVFEKLGCTMLGSWNTDGYEHEASKAVRGDKFCGLVLDEVNQEEETDGRIERWVAQLKEEGILEGTGAASGGAVPAPATTAEAPATTTAAAAATSVVINGDVSALVDDSSMAEELARLQRENEQLRNLLTSAGTSTGGGPVATTTTTSAPATVAEATPPSSSGDGFTPHYNPVTGRIMWTSSNGRKSYVT